MAVACDWAASGFGFTPSDAARIDAAASAIVDAAALYGIAGDGTLLLGLAWVESRFDPRARSKVGARGLMQLMPATWVALRDELGMPSSTDPFALQSNARAGAFLFSKLRARWGDVEPSLAAYYAGSANVKRNGWERYRGYVDAVLEAAARFDGALAWCAGTGPLGSSSSAPPSKPGGEVGPKPPRTDPGGSSSPTSPSSPSSPKSNRDGAWVFSAALTLLGILEG